MTKHHIPSKPQAQMTESRTLRRRVFAFGHYVLVCSLILGALSFAGFVSAAEPFIPRKQTKPPTPALSPAEAIQKMTVPPGFTVELVAAEPDVMNPVAMTFDERGRIWITESFEYPRREPGPGRDRVKILEDSDGDGTAETVSIFAEGLNIPSGIAVGAGGVWVANAPDILFYPDADRDGRADGPAQQVLTGFGREDTHELPNSLTWGPDGWLYGLNGVFNNCHVRYGKDNTFLAPAEMEKHPGWKINCAMFRIHPRTREFQVFCEGTSNPWGIAFNDNGDAFISACVIDHLWHLVETGYYHRQGGPYPPHTWKLESIVDYKHQMAAYCGITWFDSDAYPAEFRKKLYMGNIHGGCINVDGLERNGATYKGVKHDDFLTANDVWFMPVVQKVGPDGCLYILDWYDRYHCYQDANADPKGVDRAKGRLYRVRYKETPRAPKFDLAKETDDQLIERLASPNIFYREQAQRLLSERNDPATRTKLEKAFVKAHNHHAFWALMGTGAVRDEFMAELLKQPDEWTDEWIVRTAGNQRSTNAALLKKLQSLARSNSAPVRLQVAVAAKKLFGADAPGVLLKCAAPLGPDSIQVVPHIVWQNLYRLLPHGKATVVDALSSTDPKVRADVEALSPHILNWLFAQGDSGVADVVELAIKTLEREKKRGAFSRDDLAARTDEVERALKPIAKRLTSGELLQTQQALIRKRLEAELVAELSTVRSPSLLLMLCHWKNSQAIAAARESSVWDKSDEDTRLAALEAWGASLDESLIDSLESLFAGSVATPAYCRRLLDVLAEYDDPRVAEQVLGIYAKFDTDLKPAAVELLTSRVVWSNQLLDAIAAGKVSKDAVNVNQVRKLLKSGDQSLAKRVGEIWGKLRTDRNPQREQVVAQMRELVKNGHGDAAAGQAVFGRLCGQCHKIHGSGQEVGPDITVNGRSNFEQLLSNIFDPSLVIGGAYQPRIVSTGDGRVLTGLLVEDSPTRVVLKLQGGKLETIARSNIDEIETSKLSLMPEGVETQYKPQEIVDLFAFLRLDKPPTDPTAKTLPGFTELDQKK